MNIPREIIPEDMREEYLVVIEEKKTKDSGYYAERDQMTETPQRCPNREEEMSDADHQRLKVRSTPRIGVQDLDHQQGKRPKH